MTNAVTSVDAKARWGWRLLMLLGQLVGGLGVVVLEASAGGRTADARNPVAVTGATTLGVSAFVLALTGLALARTRAAR